MALIRLAVKRVAEIAICRGGGAAFARRQRLGRTLVLAYHNVIPHGQESAGDRSLHLPQRDFARQLDELCRTHDVVPLDAVLQPPLRRGRPRAAITLDDATSGALTAGLEELVRRGLPATFFVPPAFVPGGSFWWDAVVRLDEPTREHALSTLRGADADVRSWAERSGLGLREVPRHQCCASEAELGVAAGMGMTLAPHSWSHRNLASLVVEELRDELARPLAWLESRFPNVLPWLAWPYGRASEEAERCAASCGYTGALLVSGGYLPAGAADRLALPRMNIPSGVSIDGFTIRISGLLA